VRGSQPEGSRARAPLYARTLPTSPARQVFAVRDYDLAATLSSGQAFRWEPGGGAWTGVIGTRWVRLESTPNGLVAEAAEPVANWLWLQDYLQLDLDLEAVLATFPADEPMQTALVACRGLRLLRQDPWECLASFILSSTKQIVQIRQIVSLVCERYGEPVVVPPGLPSLKAFPSPARLAGLEEDALRSCKMGFRAPYLLAAAQRISAGQIQLPSLGQMPVEQARAALMDLPGVGRKIADCVLLFAYGFQEAFPVDVWVMKALRELYFPRRKVPLKRLHQFAAEHFGPYGGYAQQYLFHFMRTTGNGRR
jgi:N-glycosylase/DNA lyase